MARYISSMLPFAAVAALSMLSTTLPAQAAESAFGREIRSTSARTMTPGVRHRTAQRVRFAAARDYRRDRYAPANLWSRDCYGAWCGRQFVLMIGIGY